MKPAAVLHSRFHVTGYRVNVGFEARLFRPRLAYRPENRIERFFGDFLGHDLERGNLLKEVALDRSLTADALAQLLERVGFLLHSFDAFIDARSQMRLSQPFLGCFVRLFGNLMQQMAVYFFESRPIKSPDDCEVNILECDDRLSRAVNEGMIALVVDAIDGGGVIGIGARDDHTGNAHDVVLEPRGIEAGDHFSGGDQDFLSLVATDFTTGALVFDVDCADFALDEFLD